MYITFYCGNFLFALPVADVMEIKRSFPITHVPKGPSYVEGIINLRGQIITAIHLAKRIGLVSYDDKKDYYHIIIKTSEEPVSILVEEIGEVISINEKDMEPVPEHLEGMDIKYIKNISKLYDNKLIIILDSDAIQQ
ncbi:MAG: chemotaxis protein CheW [Deltaproteobacteria bacterium]|nr:MAG: chemotaxis protein CheW [Deltaproteobacteria bacterium]